MFGDQEQVTVRELLIDDPERVSAGASARGRPRVAG
jgi:hypothetical protein